MSTKSIKALMQTRSNEPTNIHLNTKYKDHDVIRQLNDLMSEHKFEHNLWCTVRQLETCKLTTLNQVAFEITLPLNKKICLFNIAQTNIEERIKEDDKKIAMQVAKKEAYKLPKEAKNLQEYEEKIKKLEAQILERDGTINRLSHAFDLIAKPNNTIKVIHGRNIKRK